MSYFTNVKERNKEINRLKYHRKKNKAKKEDIDVSIYEAF